MLFHFALRSIISHPLLNGLKVLGLALGLTGILFITLFIRHELSYLQERENDTRNQMCQSSGNGWQSRGNASISPLTSRFRVSFHQQKVGVHLKTARSVKTL